MDYTNAEQKLAKAEADLLRRKKHSEMLSKLDFAEQKLQTVLPEKVAMTVKTEENLAKGETFELPLRVSGRMLGVGRHRLKYYTVEELKKAVRTHQGRVIPIKVDHRRNEAGATIGAITNLYWDDASQAIKYEGHINDETHARNILDRVVKEVSASIEAVGVLNAQHGLIGVDLEFPEVSIVEEGAYKDNSIEPVM